jgi:hypothetical protein
LTEYPNIQPNPAHHLIACLIVGIAAFFKPVVKALTRTEFFALIVSVIARHFR